MTRPKLAIFDVDGTLVDSQTHITGALSAAFAAEGLALPGDPLRVVGLSLPEAIRTLAPDLDAGPRARLVTAYRQAYFDLRANAAPAPLYPGARAVLERLAARDDVLMGVATGKSRRGLDHVLDAHGLTGFFVTCQVADHHPSKPHPAMVLAALAETGVEAIDAAMIGDTSFDMEMSRAAGLHRIGVGWGYHGAGKLGAADRVIDSFAMLPDALNEIWGIAP